MKGLRIAVLGATGAVGREMWRLLEAASFPVAEVIALSSERSRGERLSFRGREVVCRTLDPAGPESLDLVLASAGSAVSREWAPRFAAAGAVVIDNSSAFRSDPGCPLVVPEVNGEVLRRRASIIANPNCSTIQMVAALAPLHRQWELRAVRVATYQAVSGAGTRAMRELEDMTRAEIAGERVQPCAFPHPIAGNVLPHIGSFDAHGESEEEAKMRNETRRILERPDLAVSATCVRVPVVRGHSEAVWGSFEERPDPDEARTLLAAAGITVEDDPARAFYPLPRRAAGRDDVFAGRIRRDPADPRGLCLWVVADNLLTGAATNAHRIAETVVQQGWFA